METSSEQSSGDQQERLAVGNTTWEESLRETCLHSLNNTERRYREKDLYTIAILKQIKGPMKKEYSFCKTTCLDYSKIFNFTIS